MAGRKSPRKGRKVKLTDRSAEILKAQQAAFKKKFGRGWQDGDSVFFDPDADQPAPMSEVRMQAEVLAAMRKAGTPPQIIYAYKKTGLLLTESSPAPPEVQQEWEDAIQEYFLIEEASKRPDRADPRIWSTELPELLVSPLTQQGLDQVMQVLRATEAVEAKVGMTVTTRIELAAALLASACSSGFDSAEAIGNAADGPELYSVVERIVVLRARELYGQGRA